MASIQEYLIKNKQNQIINTAELAIAYIPKYYFEKELAEWKGEEVNTMAVFFLEIYPSLSSKPKLFKIMLSTSINLKFSEVQEVEKNFRIDELNDEDDDEILENSNDDEENSNNSTSVKTNKFFALKIFKDEVFISSTIHVMSLANSKAYLRYLQQAKLPDDIPYNETVKSFKYNSEINGISLGVPDILLEMMMGELLRSKKDDSIPFRKIAGKTGQNLGYKAAKLKELPFINSVFQGLAFENINIAITKGLKISRFNKSQSKAPIEEAIHY